MFNPYYLFVPKFPMARQTPSIPFLAIGYSIIKQYTNIILGLM